MIEVISIPIEKTIPEVESILSHQGIPGIESAGERTVKLARQAVKDYLAHAEPIGIMARITNSDFEAVYRGEGNNEPDTPLDLIYPDAVDLALVLRAYRNDVTALSLRHQGFLKIGLHI